MSDIPDSPGCPVLPILLTYPPVFLQPCFHGNRWCVPPSAQAVWPVQFQFLTERSAPVPFPKETSVISAEKYKRYINILLLFIMF